jgi:hypothetical protein
MNAHARPVDGSEGDPSRTITAFQGHRRIAGGPLPDVLPAIEAAWRRDRRAPLLVFDNITSQLVELDLTSGQAHDREALQPQRQGNSAGRSAKGAAREPQHQAARGEEPQKPSVPVVARGVGRPRLGVMAREVTLLPRHWEWLNRQPGGASVTLRKLVEEARRSGAGRDRVREAQEVTYRFLLAIAGNLPGYEEAMRALFASRRERFEELLAAWPPDIRDHASRLAASAFPVTE